MPSPDYTLQEAIRTVQRAGYEVFAQSAKLTFGARLLLSPELVLSRHSEDYLESTQRRMLRETGEALRDHVTFERDWAEAQDYSFGQSTRPSMNLRFEFFPVTRQEWRR